MLTDKPRHTTSLVTLLGGGWYLQVMMPTIAVSDGLPTTFRIVARIGARMRVNQGPPYSVPNPPEGVVRRACFLLEVQWKGAMLEGYEDFRQQLRNGHHAENAMFRRMGWKGWWKLDRG